LVDIYVVQPDGGGLKRVSRHGDFCGSPKWSADSKSVIAYCMPAEDTWTHRAAPEDGETSLVRINIADGKTESMKAGPGVKIFPSVLASGEVAYVRRDKQAQGVFYASGKAGPAGNVYSPAWSPDGNSVAYSRLVRAPSGAVQKMWSRNPKYELISTGILP